MWSLGCIGMVLTKAMATKLRSSRNGKFTRQSNFGQGRGRGCTSKAERRDRWVSERGEPRPQSSVLASLPVPTRSRAVNPLEPLVAQVPLLVLHKNLEEQIVSISISLPRFLTLCSLSTSVPFTYFLTLMPWAFLNYNLWKREIISVHFLSVQHLAQ